MQRIFRHRSAGGQAYGGKYDEGGWKMPSGNQFFQLTGSNLKAMVACSH
jgi:hypothetical protein